MPLILRKMDLSFCLPKYLRDLFRERIKVHRAVANQRYKLCNDYINYVEAKTFRKIAPHELFCCSCNATRGRQQQRDEQHAGKTFCCSRNTKSKQQQQQEQQQQQQQHMVVSTNDNNQKPNATTTTTTVTRKDTNCHCHCHCKNNDNSSSSDKSCSNISSLPNDDTLATIATATTTIKRTTRLSLSRNNYNNSKHNQQQQQQQQQDTLPFNYATSQQQQEQQQQPELLHHKRRYQHYQHYQQQQQPHQQRLLSYSRTFLIALWVLSFLTASLPAIHATTLLQHQQLHRQRRQLHSDEFAEHLATLVRSPRHASNNINKNNEVRLSRNETTCKSLDIRNYASEFKQLANCTIIEGFLLITLINDASPLNETFPLLTEVTEYIIVYRVNNLFSLSQIFPNLSVIRGNTLFEGYALVVYQNRDLQDIGLSRLRAIASGGVRLERNMALCFATTVDWTNIVSRNTTEDEIVVRINRNPEECPKCPGDSKGTDAKDSIVCKEYGSSKRYCWNKKACQTICPERCRNNCIDEHTCCNESCLGGCINTPSQCTSCRHYSIHNNTCIDECPPNYFKYGRRCITAKMCEDIGYKYEGSKQFRLVHFNGTCTVRCPPGFNVRNSTCVSCGDKCEKVCEGLTIDSLERAKDLNGCTQIGTREGLTIAIKRGGTQMMGALEFGLKSVHTINTFLKVHLTYGLSSLSFFKSLRVIRGVRPFEGRFALYVLDNNDLEEIWAPNQTVQILNGSVFFHFNSKLCYETIDKLRPMLASKPTQFNKNEVAVDSNGNKGACHTVKLKIDRVQVGHSMAIVTVNNASIHFDDDRAFIGYQFYIMKDPQRKATKQSYLPCEDKWMVHDPTKETDFIFNKLEPYTQYAFYVSTMTISSERKNGQSDIHYFTTNPARPTYVQRIRARSNSSSEIVLSWDQPKNVFGKLTKYVVRAVLTQRDPKMWQQRNYCWDPLEKTFNNEDTYPERPIAEKKEPSASTCQCDANGENFDSESVQSKLQDEIEFENSLQNFVYVSNKKDEDDFAGAGPNSDSSNMYDNSIDGGMDGGEMKMRRRREAKVLQRFDDFDEDEGNGSVLLRHIRAAEEIEPTTDTDVDAWFNQTRMDSTGKYYEVYVAAVNATDKEFVFSQLRHFSLYTLSVVACREAIANDTQSLCSDVNPVDKITNKMENVDVARHLTLTLEKTNTSRRFVRLHWEPPKQPNGAIVSYTIAHQLQEPDAVEEKKCITEADYQNLTNGYIVSNLNKGNYSFRLRANSLAGEGEYTERVFIYVPPPDTNILAWVLSIVIVVILLGVLFAFFYVQHKKKTPHSLIMNPTVNPFYVSLQYVADDWEVARDRIIQLRPLGQGSFGMVYEGILKSHQNAGEDTPCAIKTVNENATDRERTNFLNEASVMKEFDTYHVVRLLGVCSHGQPALVVMELMKNGDLKSYLRAHRPDEPDDVLANYQQRIGLQAGNVQPPPYSRIYQMAIEIADGMAYLAAKKFVHRDLAARNCMVAHDLTVKIGDFGMTRDIYETDYYRKGTKGLLPVRWMPPESLRDGVYASSSDVFSYGVVLWEMATLASQPYQGLSNEQVLRYVIDGGVMERPENCPDMLYTLMQSCWHHRPSARPTFMEIISYLESSADPHFKEVAFCYTDMGQQFREKERKDRAQQGSAVSADVYADNGEAEEDTAPLRVHKFHHGYNSSVEQQRAESPVVLDEEQPHSPFSMHSAYIVSSTPDGQSKNSYNLSHNNPTLMSSLPSTSMGGGGGGGGGGGSQPTPSQLQQVPRPYFGRTATISQGDDDTSAYVQPDSDCLASASQGTDDRGYELYDPSPHFPKMPHYNPSSSSSNTNHTSSAATSAGGGHHLGTIESGGSGSARSYTPRFFTPTATPLPPGGIISDNPNYKLLEESGNSSATIVSKSPPARLAATSASQITELSENPTYQMMGGTAAPPRFPSKLCYPASYDDESNEDDDDKDDDDEEDNGHIKTELVPLSRLFTGRSRKAHIVGGMMNQQRSRSASRSRKGAKPSNAATEAATTGQSSGGSGGASNVSNLLKENWLRQASTNCPPPPNGFIGREA
ncbi:insulin-like receptor [Scaptodrosophila lebanonensis]|uniref:Tyrosine-protein kinase receptor n=1 Tax=Drosophila lebanonensis TaxID=7225 RepID=A0A6J2TA92_DROLE|nr:insulin-like receptor [Scaptodrosophila lebanonensis]